MTEVLTEKQNSTYTKGFADGYQKAQAAHDQPPAFDPNALFVCLPCSWKEPNWKLHCYPASEIWVDARGDQFCDGCVAVHRPDGRGLLPRGRVRPAPHLDDEAVNRLADFMKAKLAFKRVEGFNIWRDTARCSAADLSSALLHHVFKGDPVDVANFCMMLHWRGETIDAPKLCPSLEKRPIAFEIVDHENGPRLTWVEKIAEESGHSYNGLYRRDATTVKAQEAEEPD